MFPWGFYIRLSVSTDKHTIGNIRQNFLPHKPSIIFRLCVFRQSFTGSLAIECDQCFFENLILKVISHFWTSSVWMTVCVTLMAAHPRNTRAEPYLPQLLLCEREGVHECLCNHWQTAVYVWGLLNVKDKLRVLQNVYPEAKRKAVQRQNNPFSCEANGLSVTVWEGVFLSLWLKYTSLLGQTEPCNRCDNTQNRNGLTWQPCKKWPCSRWWLSARASQISRFLQKVTPWSRPAPSLTWIIHLLFILTHCQGIC